MSVPKVPVDDRHVQVVRWTPQRMPPSTSIASLNSSVTVKHFSSGRWRNDRTRSRRTRPGSVQSGPGPWPSDRNALARPLAWHLQPRGSPEPVGLTVLREARHN
jgi:hypothetical protein